MAYEEIERRAPPYKFVESFSRRANSLVGEINRGSHRDQDKNGIRYKTDGNCIRYARDRVAEIKSHAREKISQLDDFDEFKFRASLDILYRIFWTRE